MFWTDKNIIVIVVFWSCWNVSKLSNSSHQTSTTSLPVSTRAPIGLAISFLFAFMSIWLTEVFYYCLFVILELLRIIFLILSITLLLLTSTCLSTTISPLNSSYSLSLFLSLTIASATWAIYVLYTLLDILQEIDQSRC